jgi:hypothetical protein
MRALCHKAFFKIKKDEGETLVLSIKQKEKKCRSTDNLTQDLEESLE